MGSRQLLTDYVTSFSLEQNQLFEAKTEYDKTGKFFVSGIVQRAGSKNQNGRVYPLPVLMKQSDKYINLEIRENRAFGELDHPDSSVVNVKNASHTVEALWWKGDDLYAKLEILDTPYGNIVRNILLAGKTLGISSRGLGSVKQIKEDGTLEVQDDFEIICWDFVSNPSTQRAFMKSINEGVQHDTQINKYAKVDEIINQILSVN